MNDSKKGLGRRVDRHEHIGRGAMGLEPFRLILNDPRFAAVPKIIETPKGDDDEMDEMNLNVLRGLVEEKADPHITAVKPKNNIDIRHTLS